MLRGIRHWFWARREALDILRVIRKERMLFMKHPLFRRTLDRIQTVLNEGA